MCDTGLAIATNSICINDWLIQHDLPTRRPLSEYRIEMKQKLNGKDNIDNRTEEAKADAKNALTNRIASGVKSRYGNGPVELSGLTMSIYELYESGVTPAAIARLLHCTPANAHYHVRKAKVFHNIIKE
jgi:hypothetical protein